MAHSRQSFPSGFELRQCAARLAAPTNPSNYVVWLDWREFAGLLQHQVVVPPEFVLNCYNLNSAKNRFRLASPSELSTGLIGDLRYGSSGGLPQVQP